MSEVLDPPGYRSGWCIHYQYSPGGPSGTPSKTCKAGVEYEQFKGVQKPCFLTDGKSREGAAHCDKLRLPTPEEMAAREAWSKARTTRLFTVLNGIADWRKQHKGKSHAEVVECPACKGRLHLSIAAYNGHVHGQCETGGCVAWME